MADNQQQRPVGDDITMRGMDSSVFTSFMALFDGLSDGLSSEANLNITDYRVLLKVHQIGGRVPVAKVVNTLNLLPNVISQSLSTLEKLGFAHRARNASDKRVMEVTITDAGNACVETVNASIRNRLEEVFEPLPPAYGEALREIIVQIGANAEGVKKESIASLQDYSSLFVTTVAQTYRIIKQLCSEIVGASITECRILQYLKEKGSMVRMTDLARALHLRTDTVARASNRIEVRGWANRVDEPGRPGAVYLQLAPDGEKDVELVQGALDAYINWFSINNLSEDQIRLAFECMDLIAGNQDSAL